MQIGPFFISGFEAVFKDSSHDSSQSERGFYDVGCKFLFHDVDNFLFEADMILIKCGVSSFDGY